MKFQNWVESQGGAVGLGLKLRMQPARIRMWLRKDNSPQVVVMKKLVAMSKGELTYEDIIEGTTSGRKG